MRAGPGDPERRAATSPPTTSAAASVRAIRARARRQARARRAQPERACPDECRQREPGRLRFCAVGRREQEVTARTLATQRLELAWADARDVTEIVHRTEAAVRAAVVDDPLRREVSTISSSASSSPDRRGREVHDLVGGLAGDGLIQAGSRRPRAPGTTICSPSAKALGEVDQSGSRAGASPTVGVHGVLDAAAGPEAIDARAPHRLHDVHQHGAVEWTRSSRRVETGPANALASLACAPGMVEDEGISQRPASTSPASATAMLLTRIGRRSCAAWPQLRLWLSHETTPSGPCRNGHTCVPTVSRGLPPAAGAG